MIRHLDVQGLRVSDFVLKDVDDLYHQTLSSADNIVVFGYSLGYITLFAQHRDLYEPVNAFDLMVCDGTQFNWFCRLMGFRLRTVLSVPDITNYTLQFANRHKLKVLLLGAKAEVNYKAVTNLRRQFPEAVFPDGIDGYFSADQETDVVGKLNNLSPDILLVGISTPKKEHFVVRNRDRITASIIIPCGGMIDVYSGITKQTPAWLKKIGLATPYRIVQEPGRLLIPHVKMIAEILFRLVPVAFYHRFVLRKKDFNLVDLYR